MDSDVLSVVDVEAIIRGELDLPIEGLIALLEEGMLLGRGPVAEMLIPLIYTAMGKVPARASTGRHRRSTVTVAVQRGIVLWCGRFSREPRNAPVSAPR